MTSTFREPALVICDIIQHELELKDKQVLVYNNRADLDTGQGLQVVVAYLSGRPIANHNEVTDVQAGMLETQQVQVNELYQIDIMSADTSARRRKEEIVMALASVYAQQLQEKYQMSLARIPSSFVDVSDVEGAARMNRYSMTVAVNALYTKAKAAEYYDNIPSPEVWVDKKPEA